MSSTTQTEPTLTEPSERQPRRRRLVGGIALIAAGGMLVAASIAGSRTVATPPELAGPPLGVWAYTATSDGNAHDCYGDSDPAGRTAPPLCTGFPQGTVFTGRLGGTVTAHTLGWPGLDMHPTYPGS